MEVKLTEVMTKPLPEVRKRRCLSLRAVGDIRRLIAGATVLAIGPGLGTYYETKELVKRIVAEARIPMAIDADGLNAVAEAPDLLRGQDSDIVITPHIGEFSRLSGRTIDDILAHPIECVLDFAQDMGVTVVLKNAPSMVATPKGDLFVNPSGNPGLATAGSGDVLTGILAGMMAQGLRGEEAARVSVFLHGWAGDLAKAAGSEMGFIAGDILQATPRAINDVLDRKPLKWITFGEGS
jgi:NAD(P)H-hydrate epimerase